MRIPADAAKKIMASGESYILLDVRNEAEYAEKHIPGAILIPLDSLEYDAEEQIPQKDALILVYCRSGRRSAMADRILEDLGYTKVRDFGGILSWPYETV